jgi:hypothetical protein
VVVLAAWALGGLPLMAVRGRRRPPPIAVPAEPASVTP